MKDYPEVIELPAKLRNISNRLVKIEDNLYKLESDGVFVFDWGGLDHIDTICPRGGYPLKVNDKIDKFLINRIFYAADIQRHVIELY